MCGENSLGDVWKAPRQKSFHDDGGGRAISKLMADQLIARYQNSWEKNFADVSDGVCASSTRRAQDNSAIFINTSRDYEYFFDTQPTRTHVCSATREKKKKPQLDIK